MSKLVPLGLIIILHGGLLMWNNQAVPSQNFFKPRRSSRANNLSFVLIFPLCFFSLNAEAGEVALAWDPPSTEYGGFILSYDPSSGSYSHNLDVGTKTTLTVSNLNVGQTYFFAVRAYDTNSY